MAEDNIVQLEVTVTLPDAVAREAEARGVLTAQTLETLIKAEVQRRRVEQLFAAADRLAALPTAPLSEADIEAEIQAVRAERRAGHARHS
jgi:hypothetical protein